MISNKFSHLTFKRGVLDMNNGMGAGRGNGELVVVVVVLTGRCY